MQEEAAQRRVLIESMRHQDAESAVLRGSGPGRGKCSQCTHLQEELEMGITQAHLLETEISLLPNKYRAAHGSALSANLALHAEELKARGVAAELAALVRANRERAHEVKQIYRQMNHFLQTRQHRIPADAEDSLTSVRWDDREAASVAVRLRDVLRDHFPAFAVFLNDAELRDALEERVARLRQRVSLLKDAARDFSHCERAMQDLQASTAGALEEVMAQNIAVHRSLTKKSPSKGGRFEHASIRPGDMETPPESFYSVTKCMEAVAACARGAVEATLEPRTAEVLEKWGGSAAILRMQSALKSGRKSGANLALGAFGDRAPRLEKKPTRVKKPLSSRKEGVSPSSGAGTTPRG